MGVATLSAKGRTAPEILLAAGTTVRQQRRGLIFFHWPDADRAGHTDGWMSDAYAEAAHRLDGSGAMLAALAGVPHDPSTLLVAVSDHGGGGVDPCNHENAHPHDREIVLTLAGAAVGGEPLGPATLLDVPPTVLWALGLDVPPTYEGAFSKRHSDRDSIRPRPPWPDHEAVRYRAETPASRACDPWWRGFGTGTELSHGVVDDH